MARNSEETSRFKTDLKSFSDNWDLIKWDIKAPKSEEYELVPDCESLDINEIEKTE